MTKTLEELKELATEQFMLQLELIRELPSLPFSEMFEFRDWYTNNPLQKEIVGSIQKEIVKRTTKQQASKSQQPA